MFNPLTLDAPYDELSFLDKLPGYDSSVGVIEQLDLAKEIQQSGNYIWAGVSFPLGNATLVNGGVTLNGTIQAIPGSYITSIQIFNDYATNPAGFKFTLYDKGTKAPIFYGAYALDRIGGSNMGQQVGQGQFTPSDPGMNADSPFGPQYRMSPLIITKPGVLGWELVNIGVTAQMQVLICLAIPVNARSTNSVVVDKG